MNESQIFTILMKSGEFVFQENDRWLLFKSEQSFTAFNPSDLPPVDLWAFVIWP